MLKIKNLNNPFLKDISFEVADKGYLSILGPSGAGKTVLLELISGVRKAEGGKIFIDERDVTLLPPEKRNISLLYQNFMLFPHLNVFENIAFSLKIKKVKNIKEKVEKIAKMLKIENLLERTPNFLSGGEKQRVALARSIIKKPALLLLDEPTSSVDSHLKEKLLKVIKTIHKELNIKIIHVTHNIDETLFNANSIVILNKGKIIQTGSVNEVFANPKNQFVAKFLGYKNIFFGTVKNGYFIPSNESVSIFLGAKVQNCSSILIPSQNIVLSKNKLVSSMQNTFKGVVKNIIGKKEYFEVFVDIGITLSTHITKLSVEELSLSKGKKVFLSFKALSVKCF